MPRQNRVALALFYTGIFLYMAVSPALMTVLHIPYDAPTGSFIFKIHIGTYLILLAYVIVHGSHGNPLRSIWGSFVLNKKLAFYLGTNFFLIAYSIYRYGPSGSAFIIDTLMMPAICSLLLLEFDDATQIRFFYLILSFITFNAIVGILESIFHARLVPHTVAGGVELKEDIFRSTAFLGHPLNSALITGPMLFVCLTARMTLLFRLAILGVLLLGLLSFGGRTSFLLTTFGLSMYLLFDMWRNVIAGRYSYLQIIGSLILPIFMVGTLVTIVLATGIGERIFGHLFLDNSATVRARIWQVFNYMTVDDVIFGLPPTEILKIAYRLSLIYPLETIENFWLVMLMQMGVVGFIPFVLGLFQANLYFWRRISGPARIGLVLFFIVASSNNSLTAKVSSMTILFTALTGLSAYLRVKADATPNRPAHIGQVHR